MFFFVDQSRAKWMDQQWGYRTWFWGLHGYRCGVPIKVPRNCPVQQQFAPDCCSTGWWFEIFFGLKPPSTFWVGDFFLLFFNVSGRTSQTIPCEANTWLASRCSISSASLFTLSPCKSRLRMIQGIYFMGFWCCIHIQLIMVWKVWRPLKGTKGNMRKRRAAGGTCLHVYTCRGDGHWRVGQVCFPAQSWEKPCLAWKKRKSLRCFDFS